MGQKVRPTGFRTGIMVDWQSRWYANKQDFAELLVEDVKLRRYIKKYYNDAGISRIRIERTREKVVVFIYAARVGVIIGKQGREVDKLTRELEALTHRHIEVKTTEVTNPEVDPQLVAEDIAKQMEKRSSFRRTMKRAMDQTMEHGAKGVRIQMSGRLGGSEMARCESSMAGSIPLSTLRTKIEYGFTEAHTAQGKIGIKVWINNGDYLDDAKGRQAIKVPMLGKVRGSNKALDISPSPKYGGSIQTTLGQLRDFQPESMLLDRPPKEEQSWEAPMEDNLSLWKQVKTTSAEFTERCQALMELVARGDTKLPQFLSDELNKQHNDVNWVAALASVSEDIEIPDDEPVRQTICSGLIGAVERLRNDPQEGRLASLAGAIRCFGTLAFDHEADKLIPYLRDKSPQIIQLALMATTTIFTGRRTTSERQYGELKDEVFNVAASQVASAIKSPEDTGRFVWAAKAMAALGDDRLITLAKNLRTETEGSWQGDYIAERLSALKIHFDRQENRQKLDVLTESLAALKSNGTGRASR
jgi:small subunit ribosomal protein S3